MDIQDYERKYTTAQTDLRTCALSPRSKSLIEAFINDLVLENLTKQRLTKYIRTLKLIGLRLGKDLDTVDETDLKKWVSNIQQRSDYTVWTKHDYKLVLRRFYKWLQKSHQFSTDISWINLKINRAEKKLPSEGELSNRK